MNRRGDAFEHRVSTEMPMLVVDAFEVVDVEHQHRDGPARATRTAQLAVEDSEGVGPIETARQVVGNAIELKLLDDLHVAQRDANQRRQRLDACRFPVAQRRRYWHPD